MEEAAEDYLKDLIDRNKILVRERKWNGRIRSCGIHDTVRELCLKVMKKEKFIYVLQDKDTTQGGIGCRERRVVIPERKLNSDMINALESAPLLRSLTRRPKQKDFHDYNLWADLRLLRILHHVNSYVLLENDGPPYLANDPHFRQLNLRWLDIMVSDSESPMRSLMFFHIPSSVSLLWNMQSLSVQYLFDTARYSVEIIVPCEIWEMPQLRQLVIEGYIPDPVPVPNEEKCIVLRNLHTLKVENLRFTEEVCKRMPNIKVLNFSYENLCGGCEAVSYYCSHNLGRFNKLERLTIFVRDYDSKWRDVILSFTFPASLEALCLWISIFHWEDLTMMFKSLHNLAYLELNWIKGREWNLVDEKFSCLKELKISFCSDLIYWNADSSHFPVLEILYIWLARKLSEIPFDFGEIPTLRRIELHACSASAAVSVRIVVEQERLGNHSLQLHVKFLSEIHREIFLRMVQQEDLTISPSVSLR